MERVLEITGGHGVAAVYDSVGKETFEQSFGCLQPLGMLVSFGQFSGRIPPFDLRLLAQHRARCSSPAPCCSPTPRNGRISLPPHGVCLMSSATQRSKSSRAALFAQGRGRGTQSPGRAAHYGVDRFAAVEERPARIIAGCEAGYRRPSNKPPQETVLCTNGSVAAGAGGLAGSATTGSPGRIASSPRVLLRARR